MRISDWSSDVCSSDLGRRWASSDDVAMVSTPDPAAYEAILRRGRSALAWEVLRRNPAYRAAYADLPVLPPTGVAADADRSEERRVGKEFVRTCRYRWSPSHYKKKAK